MPVLQIRKEIGDLTELIPRHVFPSASLKKSPTFLSHINQPVTVMPKEFDERKLEPTTKDGPDLGDEVDENKLEELKVVIVIGGDAEYIKKL